MPRRAERRIDAEHAEICRLLTEAMEAGGAGFSAELLGEGSAQRDYDGTPMITDTMAEDDLLAFARVLGKLRYGFTQFMGGTFDLHEKVAQASGRPVVYNLIAVGARDQHGG